MFFFPEEHEWIVEFRTAAGALLYTATPLSASMTLDENWSPYGQFRGTFALPPEETSGSFLTALDPQQTPPPYIALTMRKRIPPNGPHDSRTIEMWVRTRTLNLRERTMDFTAETAECLLQDYIPAGTATHITYPSLVAPNAIKYTTDFATQAAGGSTFVNVSSGTAALDSGFIWKRGVTAWAVAQSAAELNGSRLYATPEQRLTFRLVNIPLNDSSSAHILDPETSVIDYVPSGTREEDNWADAVTVRYRWTDASNVAQERLDRALAVPTVADVWKTVFIERDTPYPGAGAAAGMLTRIRSRTGERVEAMSSYFLIDPGRLMTLDRGDKWGFFNKYLGKVTWSWPEKHMELTMRSA